MNRSAKVYLVGAGPGPADLLTLKAVELLQSADVIVYDRLMQGQVLTFAKPTAERIYMGKPLGRHDSRQGEIHHLLLRKASEGKMVVRLKGGDPFLFGRGGEEAEFLAEHHIPFEVVPGVSSALAAPLRAGIAVTHRDTASAMAIVTGHEATKNAGKMDWQVLSQMETLVFLMVVRNIGRVCQELLAHGRDPSTPAAVIQMAFWPEEKVVSGTLADMAEKAERDGINPPATLVVGEVVRLREKLKGHDQNVSHIDAKRGSPPIPMPHQLFRLAAAGMGSKILGWALSVHLFDRLECFQSAASLAQGLGLNPERMTEMLDCLVALGLLECTPSGYRNLEMASIYLRTDSLQNLGGALLSRLGQSSQWQDLCVYVRDGHSTSAVQPRQELCRSWWEGLASLAAPSAVRQLHVPEHGRVLLSGWGGKSFREPLSRRWPHLVLEEENLLLSPPYLEVNKDHFDAVVLSGVLFLPVPAIT